MELYVSHRRYFTGMGKLLELIQMERTLSCLHAVVTQFRAQFNFHRDGVKAGRGPGRDGDF